jgi:adenylate cyclase
VPPPWWVILILALILTAAGAATATIERRPAILLLAISLQAVSLALLPIALHHLGYDILYFPLFGLLLSWLAVFAIISYALRSQTSIERAFARGALGKFLPENVALEILNKPEKLKLEGEERLIYMLFTDLEGFTKFSHARPPQEMASILNRYLEEMSQVILDHSGTIDKFVGDAIVAFWGAPLQDDNDASNSVACALALHTTAERLRLELASGKDQLGRTRIGLHFGEVTVGNFGGERRIQYTAMGDAMNIAARLEGANKYLRTNILVSGAVKERAPEHSYRPMGAIRLSGVATAIQVFEPVDDTRDAYTADLTDVMTGIEEKASGAKKSLLDLATKHPKDLAIAAAVDRIDQLTMETPYELGGK